MSGTNHDTIRQFSGKSSGVRLHNVTKIFSQIDKKGEFVAVNSVNLDIRDGELVTLLGPSGCGKTTTLRMISGFEYPTAGEIFIGSKDVAAFLPIEGVVLGFQSSHCSASSIWLTSPTA
jgi:iron(III) transport system ATP-binding protein